MAPKRPDGFKKSSSNEEFTKNKLNAQASLHKPNTLGYESDTNVVPSPSQNEKQNTANLKATTQTNQQTNHQTNRHTKERNREKQNKERRKERTTERKKGVFVALV